MKIKAKDLEKYAMLIEFGKVTNEMAQREYGRSSELMNQAVAIREKAFQSMDEGRKLSEKTDEIVESGKFEIRSIYEVMNRMAQREYERSSELLDEAKKLREKAFEFMEQGSQLAAKTDGIIEQANAIREKYEAAGMVYEFVETYEGYVQELEDE